MKVTDLAKVVAPDCEQEIIGIRPGEKLHEQMIGIEDAPTTYSYDGYYKILPAINEWAVDCKRIKDGIKIEPDFTYSSDNNEDWMSSEELQAWLENNKKA